MFIILFQKVPLFNEEEGGQLSIRLLDVGRAHVMLLREAFSNDSVKFFLLALSRFSVYKLKCDV